MKKLITILVLLVSTGIFNYTNAQNSILTLSCTENHPGYTAVPDSGKLLPNLLDTATVGVPFSQALTIGIPGHASGYPVNWIQLNAMTNYLTGNTWTVYDSVGVVPSPYPEWTALTWQCAIISGTPTVAGVDSLTIYVNANVTVPIIGAYTASNQKAFTKFIVVKTVTGLIDYSNSPTTLIESYPNPYQNTTTFGVSTGKAANATLHVFSTLGQLVYSENLALAPGKNYFKFDGSKLSAGTYIYSITTPDKTFNRKLIKTQ